MARIGGIGHRGLPSASAKLIEAELYRKLVELARDGLTGVACLADGADQIFARSTLAVGGELEVVVPATRYREGLPENARAEYDRLLEKASHVHHLQYQESTEQAHLAAGQTIVDQVDRLLAVWDGRPARGVGGTADVVEYARLSRVPVDIVWPSGASRE
jgi:hypothetical protein